PQPVHVRLKAARFLRRRAGGVPDPGGGSGFRWRDTAAGPAGAHRIGRTDGAHRPPLLTRRSARACAEDPVAEPFYSQIAANKRNSFLLTLVIVVLFALLGFSIGYAIGGDVTSALFVMVIAVVVGALISAVSYFSGASLVLAASSAKEVDASAAPQLMNVIQEL